ncbi:MAG TPA: ABC transporter ATP-binding protein [Solirubrobacteraceae bacterium]|nr:ABC transporter ATP-binding protein [Solirubrobacteraceae bacterium]
MTTATETAEGAVDSVGQPLLSVEDLRVSFHTDDGIVHAVDGISYALQAGKTLGIVGESGSGKTVSSLTTLGLTRSKRSRISGRIMFQGEDIVAMDDSHLRRVRGNDVSMIFQDPLSALHPFYKVGVQLVEAMQVHRSISKSAARRRSAELLELVGIPDPKRRVDQYPHEFSGGMRQRAMIAMALANEPKLLIADEPTTALDVTVQAQILALLQDLQQRLGTAIIIITHDLGVVAEIADDICVMYAGRIVERGSTEDIFNAPQHPYTWGLLSSIPRLDSPRDEELVPISGRPPSLINRPSGCHFHPRCPYVRDAHRRVDPKLTPVDGSSEHAVACSLESSVRARIWDGIRTGRDAESLVRIAAASPEPEVPAAALEAPESEGTDIEPSEEGVVESERHGEQHLFTQPVDEVDHRLERNEHTGEVITGPEDT